MDPGGQFGINIVMPLVTLAFLLATVALASWCHHPDEYNLRVYFSPSIDKEYMSVMAKFSEIVDKVRKDFEPFKKITVNKGNYIGHKTIKVVDKDTSGYLQIGFSGIELGKANQCGPKGMVSFNNLKSRFIREGFKNVDWVQAMANLISHEAGHTFCAKHVCGYIMESEELRMTCPSNVMHDYAYKDLSFHGINRLRIKEHIGEN